MSPLFDPRRPGFLADPYPDFAALRAREPVHWCEGLKSWVITGYDLCKQALNDPQLSADRISPFRDSLGETERRRIGDLLAMLEDWMVFADPPRHTRLRRAANQIFPPRVMEGMAPRVQAIVAGLIDGMAERRAGDLIRDFGFPLPVMVIADMLGLPLEDQDKFKVWSDDLATFVGSAQLTPDKRARAQDSARAMCDYVHAAVAARRREPRDDRLTRLMALADESGELSEREMVATCVLLLFAGHETTTNLIGNGMLALMRHPAELEGLRRQPELTEAAVEEMLRYDGPTLAMTRIALEDVDYGGTTFRKGDRIFVFLAAANRDPARFPDPDRLDIAREDNRHLTFGYGIHFCLGAPLARLEGRIAIRALLARLGAPALAEPAPEWIDSLSLRGVGALPVTFPS
ncbi:MAG: cytochrome P450 [Alphaproteobacteria bacterium]|nr:cytochrome P450 [Alphaproteobacteria bacterium]